MELDDFDRRLLEALQQDNRQTGDELAAKVGLSAAACLRRAQRLREIGAIVRDVALLAPEATGRRLTVIVLVTVQRDSPDANARFKAAMLAAPEVTQCHYVTGPADYVLTVAVEDMDAYQRFTQRCLSGASIKRFDSLVSMDRVKFETALPVAQD